MNLVLSAHCLQVHGQGVATPCAGIALALTCILSVIGHMHRAYFLYQPSSPVHIEQDTESRADPIWEKPLEQLKMDGSRVAVLKVRSEDSWGL